MIPAYRGGAHTTWTALRITNSCVLALLLVASATGVRAANLGWLRGTVVQGYSSADLAILTSELEEALDFQPAGTVITWYNWESGNWGRITPLAPLSRPDAECRRVNLENHRGDEQGSTTYLLCRQAGSEWMFAGIE
jgi:surface antigen